MASTDPNAGDSIPKKHSRHGSSGRALPRRPTRGPLNTGDSPLSPLSNPVVLPTTTMRQQSSLLSPTASAYGTPRMPSPQLGSNLSAMSGSPSFRTAHTSVSPSRSTLISQKDFSFLLRPEIYHPLALLDVPPPFRVTSAQPDPSTPLPDLVRTGQFRSAAIKAAQILTSPGINPADHETIFELVYTRLSCLTLCNQTTLASQEVKALEDLNAQHYRDDLDGSHLAPWELRVLSVWLQGTGFKDARRGVMGYYDLAREARLTLTGLKKTRAEKEELGVEGDVKLWEERLAELGLRIASALVEMDDLEGATRFMSTLKAPSNGNPEGKLRLEFQKALLWLCLGDVEAARVCVAGGEVGGDENVIVALGHMADADFGLAVKVWESLLEGEGSEGEKAMWRQNLGVCLLYLGRMDMARALMESLISEGHSFHALTFNLSTIYELCTERSRALKIDLAEKVAKMQEEDGQRNGWEKVNGDFKL